MENQNETLDLYQEHSQHIPKMPRECSTCFSEIQAGALSIDEKNEGQKRNLTELRKRIEQSRAQIEKEKEQERLDIQEQVRRHDEQKMQFVPVPEIQTPGQVEFNLYRHTQLVERTNALYHNYLVAKNRLVTTEEIAHFENILKDLCQSYEETIDEGLKVRF